MDNPEKLIEVIETGITSEPKVVSGLGYPNNREVSSPAPTGWQASKLLKNGLIDEDTAKITKI